MSPPSPISPLLVPLPTKDDNDNDDMKSTRIYEDNNDAEDNKQTNKQTIKQKNKQTNKQTNKR